MVALVALLVLKGVDPYVAYLPDGTKITLLSISDDIEHRAWRPDGEPTKLIKLDVGWPVDKPAKGQLAFFFRIEPKSVPPEPKTRHMEWQPALEQLYPPPPKDLFGHIDPDKFGPKKWVVVRVATIPNSASETDLSVRATAAPWREVRRARYRHGVLISGNILAGSVSVPRLSAPMNHAKLGPAIPVRRPSDTLTSCYQVVAYDRHHNELCETSSVKDQKPGSVTWEWFNGSPWDVAEIQLQSRRFSTVRFKNVRTHQTVPKERGH